MKVPVAVDVSATVRAPRVHQLRGFVAAPSDLAPATEPPIVLCCLPGGRCTTGYFDLQVDGLDGYSMADHLTAQGFVVVALDHLGVGASSPVEDICAVTVFLGFGDQDLTTRPHAAVAAYRSSRDVTLLVVAGSGHCHHQSANRVMLWDRVGAWARRIAQ